MRKDLLATAFMFVGVLCGAMAAPIDHDLIPDSATAIKVGGTILETYLGKSQFGGYDKKRAPEG